MPSGTTHLRICCSKLLTDVEQGEGTWVIVERVADDRGQTYGQVLRASTDSWVTQHREGTADSHVGTTVSGLRDAHRLLTGWAFGLAGWDVGAEWTRVG